MIAAPLIRLSRRAFYVDAVRACACVLVVFSHVFAPICAAPNAYPLSVWWGFNLFNSLIRPSAALYVMISGKIFLGSTRDESYQRFVWKRYARLLPPFFAWSMIYAFYNSSKDGELLSWGAAFQKFLQGPTEYHLWFMYMILGLYLVMPLLRRFVRHATGKELAFVVGIWFAFLTLQFLVPGYSGFGPAYILVSYGGYALLGYALDKFDFSHQRPAGWALLWGAILIFNAAGTYVLTLFNNGVLNEKLYFGAAPLVALQGAAMFILLKRCNQNSILFRNRWLHSAIDHLSRHSYNVYLSHALFIWLFTKGDFGFVLSENTAGSPWLGVPLTTAAVLACSLGVSMIFQKLPVFSKLLVISAPAPRPDSDKPADAWPQPLGV